MSQKIRINDTVVNTYSYLKGNFSEEEFIISEFNDSDVEIDNLNIVNFGNDFKNKIEILCKKINKGINQDIVEDLLNGKCVNIASQNDSVLSIKDKLTKNTSTISFNIECNENDSLYVTSEISGSNEQFNHFYYINAKKNSNVKLVIFTNSSAKGFISVLGESEDESNIEIVFVNVNRNSVYTNCELYLNGKKSSSDMQVCYICRNDFKYDYNLTSAMVGQESVSQINGKGILLDSAKKVFRGTIDFKKGCLNANGNESEEVIILSKNVKNQSLPLLLCNEKNVKGSHGFTANSINKDKVFYLLSRGFNEKEAKGLILMGKFLNILNRINNKDIIDKFMDVLMEAI